MDEGSQAAGGEAAAASSAKQSWGAGDPQSRGAGVAVGSSSLPEENSCAPPSAGQFTDGPAAADPPGLPSSNMSPAVV